MKTDFIQEMFNDMPATIGAFLETPIGDVTDIPIPTTRDAAVLACGQLAANLNNAFLKPFVGLTPIELFMRIGSKNPVFISSLLSGLEVISGSGGKCQIDFPKHGESLPFVNCIVVSGIGLQSVSATLNESEFSLSDEGEVWNFMFSEPLDAGSYSLMISATFDDGATGSDISVFTVTAEQNAFAINEPKNGQNYPVGNIPLGGSGSNISGVSVAVDGQTIQLSNNGDQWTASVSLSAGEYTANFTTSFQDGSSRPEAPINFSVT